MASRRWLELSDSTPAHGSSSWRQLVCTWVFFVVSAGVYHIPSTLLGGRCPNATLPCSLAEEFPETTPAALGWLPSTFLLVKGFLAYPAGMALHRYGARACIVIGTALLLVATAIYAAADAFWLMPLLYSFFGVAYCLAGLTPVVVHINSWFASERKATSIGLLVTGFSTAGVLWPTLVASVAESRGWRVAALLLPGACLLIALPIAIGLLRDGPFGGGRRAASSSDVELTTVTSTTPPPPPQQQQQQQPPPPPPPQQQQQQEEEQQAQVPATGFRASGSWRRDPIVWHLGGMSVCILYLVNAVQVMRLTRSLRLIAAGRA